MRYNNIVFLFTRKVDVKNFGAKGDGNTNDTKAINDAIQYVYKNGGGTVLVPEGKYVLKRRIPSSQEGSILLKPGVSLVGTNATLLMRDNATFITAKSDSGNDNFEGHFDNPGVLPPKYASIIENISYGSNTVIIDNPSAFAVGNEVFLRAGDNEYDIHETKYYTIAKVTNISGNKLTLDKTIGVAMDIADTNINNRKICVINKVMKNITIKGFNLINDIENYGNAESGITLDIAENINIKNINGENPGAGLIGTGYSSNISINSCIVSKSIKQNGHSAKGRCFGFYNSEGITLKNIYVENFEQLVCFNESYTKNVKFENIKVNNNNVNKPRSLGLFVNVQNSECEVKNIEIDGNGGCPVFDNGATPGNSGTSENVTINTKQMIGAIDTNEIKGYLKIYDNNSGQYVTFNMNNVKRYEVRIDLKDGMNGALYYLPAGLWVSFSIYTSPNVSPGDFTWFSIGREGDYNNGNNYANLIIPGKEYNVSAAYGSIYPVYSLYDLKSKINVNTASNIGENKYAIVKINIVAPTK